MTFTEMFSNRLQSARLAAHMTQEELGVLVGKSKSTISMYENGRRMPDLMHASMLAVVLKMPIEDLIPKAEPMLPKVSNGQTRIDFDSLRANGIEVLNG